MASENWCIDNLGSLLTLYRSNRWFTVYDGVAGDADIIGIIGNGS